MPQAMVNAAGQRCPKKVTVLKEYDRKPDALETRATVSDRVK